MLNNRICAFAAVFLFATTFAIAEPTTQPSAESAAPPSTQPSVSADARTLLDQVAKAYTEANALDLTGKLSLDFDAGGEQHNESADFTASFAAPNKFRHEIKDDVLIVSTGEKVYAYLPSKNEYVAADAPKDRADAKDLSDSISDLLAAQDPVLLLAISKDPAGQLLDGAGKVALADDAKLGDASYKVLTLDKGDQNYRLLIDPMTHFVRQVQIDRRQEVSKRGMDDVKKATVTFDYLTTKTDAPSADLFAWTPPRDATVAKEDAPQDGTQAATALEGKPAPNFKLTALDGSTVSMSDLKGHVTVLDFWATWCGPCVASLPLLDQTNTDLAGKDVKIYAINAAEPKATVEKFMTSKKLTLPVLLDSDGATGTKYMANAIPETVVIGKDGVVKKVFIGFSGDEDPLHKAIEAELAK